MHLFDRLTHYSVHWWLDALDVLLIIFLVFQIYKFVKGTTVMRIFIGAIAIYSIWKLTQYLNMELLSEVLGQFIGVGVIALIVVFQQEIRKFLLLIASPKFYNRFWLIKWFFKFKKNQEPEENVMIKPLVSICERLSKSHTGALMVIGEEHDLSIYKSLGENINAELSANLLESIFHKESPMHDGAVLISDNRIISARCVLPLSDRKDLPARYGLRHRAAIGVTESSHTIAIVVSEENGSISVCNGGKLTNNVSLKRLATLISFQPE